MADTKYTMIGMTSSGKTCYITAMYMKMSAGFDGFTLVTDDITRAKLERDILTLRKPTGQERFPTATNATKTRSYEFRLSYETKKIITFEMLDYAGGLLRSRGIPITQADEPIEENSKPQVKETITANPYEQIKNSIAESTALYIFVDGKSFCTDDREERKENVYYDCALTVTPIIQDFADTHGGYLPPIVFVVTKADLCKQYVSSEEIATVIKELFSPAFSEGTYTYICAVSLGDTISDDDYKGRFRPVNIHIPFFIGSYHEYFNRCVALISKIEAGNSDLEKEKSILNSHMAKELKKWKILRKESYLEELLQATKNNEAAQKSNKAVLDSTKNLFYKFGAKLESESPNFKCFINGIEQSRFKEFNL